MSSNRNIHAARSRIGASLVLGLILCLAVGSAVRASETGPTAVAQAPLAGDDPQAAGHYHLWRQGNQVTASLVGRRLQAADGKRLFVVPEGFRPSAPVQWPVTRDQLGRADGQSTGPEWDLTLRVLPNGTVHQHSASPRESGELLRYATQMTWLTAEPLLSTAGPYREQHLPMRLARTEGVYHLERRGSQVWATLMARYPLVVEAGRSREPLFLVPEGLRPVHHVAWPMVDARGNQFELNIGPQGAVTYGPQPRYPNGEALPHDDLIAGYHTRFSWTTAEPARLVAAGHFLARPVPGAGHYYLERRAHSVLAHVAATAAPVPPWVRPSLNQPQVSLRSWDTIFRTDLEIKSLPYRQGATLGKLEPGPETQFDLLGQSTGYRQRPYEWQIGFADGTVGWVKSFPLQTQGNISEVPVTSRLFQVPAGFRPSQIRTWTVKAQSVDLRGQDLPPPGPADLEMQVSPAGLVTYALEGTGWEAGYRRYRQTLVWPAATDLCYRSTAIQKAILRALHHTDYHAVACARVTWSELASIHTLELTPRDLEWEFSSIFKDSPYQSFLPHDLSGLSGLQSLKVLRDYQYGVGQMDPGLIPPLFLAHVPRLRELSMEHIYLTDLPSDFLVHTPQLQRLALALALDEETELPPGFLDFTPHLQSLDLRLAPGPTQLPTDFLAHTPPLRHLRLSLSPELLAQLPAHLFAVTPHLETLHLEVTPGGQSPLPPGFLQHTPQLQEAIIWQNSAPPGTPAGQLVLADPAAFLAHAPQLQRLWLHRVAAGSDFVAGLPATTAVHWVPRDSAPFPPLALLAATEPQSWLHLHGAEPIPPSLLAAEAPLHLAITLASLIVEPDLMMVTWLSQLHLRGLFLDAARVGSDTSEQLLKAAKDALPFPALTRVSLLLDRVPAFPLLADLLAQHTFDWLYLKPLPLHALPPDFFADFTATALLLEQDADQPWSLLDFYATQRPAWRQLLQAPRVQHLGLILNATESHLELPPGLLGELDFTCLELQLSPYQPTRMNEALQPLLAAADLRLEWLAVEESEISFPRWAPWNDHRLQLARPTWFEASHIPWAQARGCSRSLFLHLRSANQVILSPEALAPVGELRHVRLTYSRARCLDCPSAPVSPP